MTLTSKEGGAVVENVIRFIIIILFSVENVKASARQFPLNQVELCTMRNKKQKPGLAEKVKNVKVAKVKM